MDYNLSQPRTMSWNFGIQRKIGESRALEVRYAGNRTIHQWLSLNVNEVNVFENGFLQEFKNAQRNLAINGGRSFANLNPAGGTVAVPILTGAFTGDRNGSQTNSQFRSGTFITQLNTGAVGSMAQTLTTLGAVPYFCNLVGASFTPCATNAGCTGAGAGYTVNFFQANPYASGIPATVMTDPGWSNYHAMQVDSRITDSMSITISLPCGRGPVPTGTRQPLPPLDTSAVMRVFRRLLLLRLHRAEGLSESFMLMCSIDSR